MSHLQINMKCLNSWQSVWTTSSDLSQRKHGENEANAEIKYTSDWGTYTLVAYLLRLRRAWAGMIHPKWVAASQSWLHSDLRTSFSTGFQISVMSELQFYGRKYLAVNAMPNAMNPCAVCPDHLTLWDADSEVCLNVYYMPAKAAALAWISELCLIFWYRYTILPRLSLLANRIGKYALLHLS